MDSASATARFVRPIDAGLLATAAHRAAEQIRAHDDPAAAIEAAIDTFYEAVAGVMPSVFVLEHRRLWLVAQRGYAVVPDGSRSRAGSPAARSPGRPTARDRRARTRTTSRRCRA